LEAICLVAITSFTGWRSHSVVSLKCADVVLTGTKLELACTAFKNVGERGLPSTFVSFPKLPDLWFAVRRYVISRLTGNEVYLFNQKTGPAPTQVAQAMVIVATCFGKELVEP
jgi:hypothetical protein